MGERLYRITVEAITIFTIGAKPSTHGSFGAQLEEAIDDGDRVRWKKVGGPLVHDDSPEAALLNMAQALEHYGGVDGYREAVAEAKRNSEQQGDTAHNPADSAPISRKPRSDVAGDKSARSTGGEK